MRHRTESWIVTKWVEENQGKHFCKCGCGGVIEIKRHHYDSIPKYVRGHKGRSKVSLLIDEWINNHQGKHFCHCGCDKEIEIKRDHYNDGIPKYIKGHYLTTDECKNKLSEMREGENNPFYGMHHTEEVLEGRRSFKGVDNPNYGRSHTDTAKRAIGDASIERWDDPDYREKMLKVLLSTKTIRRNTSIEIKIQNILRQYGYFFQIHVPICNICIPDIILSERKIIIQCDGDYWHNYPDGLEKDRNQDKILTENGWRVIRFWEHEINENIQDCLRKFEAVYHDTEYISYYTQGTLEEWMCPT